jgi:hypothetical protein
MARELVCARRPSTAPKPMLEYRGDTLRRFTRKATA